jgi:UDP-N-acetylmuramate--alanine ligase
MDSLRPGWPGPNQLRNDSDMIGVAVGGTVVRRVYCVGMAGTGMKAIAEWFSAAGWQVSGSDRSATPTLIAKFQSRGMRLHAEHSADHLPPLLDLLIYSPAVPVTNPERQAAMGRGVPQWSYPQALGQLMQGRDGISIAGTHGKSTTTALVGHILRSAGLAPSILCGAEMIDTGLNGVLGKVAYFSQKGRPLSVKKATLVAESCEYRGHFLELSPRVIGLLGIEPDHFDCFPTFDRALATYRAFVEKLPSDGLLIVNRDCEAICSIVPTCPARQVFVSTTDERADYFVSCADSTKAGLSLSVRLPDQSLIEIDCPLWGQHHAINVVTALAIGREQGVCPETCRDAIATFAGIGRRFEHCGDWNGVTWIDDYAHHPTAVRAVLDAIRDRYSDRRVWCVFQPHQVSRTRELSEGFVTALRRADGVLVLPVFGARESLGTERTDLSRQLVEGVNRLGGTAHFVADLDHTRTTLETHTRPGDIVLTVGAGDIDRIYHEFTGRLQTHHAS